jgi:hypothetical protein
MRRSFSRRNGLAAGYKSGLEETVAVQIRTRGTDPAYEQEKIKYVKPERMATYTPDFKLPNGIFIETKGRFITADRQKHVLIADQHPHLDIRFVFTNPNARISKTSATTYAMWCDKNGFKYAKGTIPDAWFTEGTK